MPNKFNTHLILEKMNQVKTTIPTLLANQGQRFFKQRFDEHGWNDQAFEPWAERAKKDSGRAILVKSGALKRFVGMSAKTITFIKIEFIVPLPYAAIQNQGGIIHKEAGEIVNHFRGNRFSKVKKATHAQKNSFGAHDIVIPRRQFMGDSATLRKMQVELITKNVDKIWKY